MLRLEPRTPATYGLYRTGQYMLVIGRIRDGLVDIRESQREATYIFRPNPTDIDSTIQFPNTVAPDQEGDFYVNVNEVGKKTVNIRGTTGQYPIQSAFESALAQFGVGTNAISSAVAPFTEAITGERNDGYHIWHEFVDFFVTWAGLIRGDPNGYAMVYINTKDLQVFHVLPMLLQETRTSARPITYGYALELEVIGELGGSLATATSWTDEMSNIRHQMRRWKDSIDRSLLLASNLIQNVSLGAIDLVYGPITNTLTSMQAGIQGLANTSEAITNYAGGSHDRMIQAAEDLFSANTYTEGFQGENKAFGKMRILPESSQIMIPPSSANIYDVYIEPINSIMDGATIGAANAGLSSQERSTLDMDHPNWDIYADSLQFAFQGYLATDLAPLPDYTPSGDAGAESRDMHRVARAGAAGVVDERVEELTSAKLAGDTHMVADTTYSTELRHGNASNNRAVESYSLSYMAAQILPAFARSHNERVSPQLNAFRKWFLGMGDPASFSRFYRTIQVAVTDNIYTLARQHLGTWTRWPEIALINGLKYPYISKNGGAYQKAPGENIHIPHPNAKVPAEVLERFEQIVKVHDKLTTQDIFLGFDLEVNQNTGDTTFVGGDLAHTAGQQAFAQEMDIAMAGSRGSRVWGENIGPAIRLGSKGYGGQTIELWRGLLRQWLSSDVRVASVPALEVRLDGDVLLWSAKLKFEHLDTTVSVAGSLRN